MKHLIYYRDGEAKVLNCASVSEYYVRKVHALWDLNAARIWVPEPNPRPDHYPHPDNIETIDQHITLNSFSTEEDAYRALQKIVDFLRSRKRVMKIGRYPGTI